MGQDKLLNSGASKRLARMAERVEDFTRGLCRSIVWYDWHDPLYDRTVSKDIPGTDLSIPVNVVSSGEGFEYDHGIAGRTPFQGEWSDFKWGVEPYSMQHRSPEQKLAVLMEAVNLYGTLMQPAMAQGEQLSITELFDQIATLRQIPELRKLIKKTAPASPEDLMRMRGGGGSKPGKPNGRYVREGRPGPTQRTQENVLMQSMMGANPQRSQTAGVR